MNPSNLRFLIVEDEEVNRAALVATLKEVAEQFRHDLAIEAVSSGIEALALLRIKGFDVIMVDYHLSGGMFGDEIIDHLPDPLGSMAVVLISARPERELEGVVVRRHRQLGRRFRYIGKPASELSLKALYLDLVAFLKERALPHPIAHASNSIDVSGNNQAKLTAIKDFVEAVMRLSASIVIAEKRHSNIPYTLPRINLEQGFTLGTWVKIVGALAGGPSISQFCPELGSVLVVPLRSGQGPIEFFHCFKKLRDEKLGHGHVHEEEFYGALIAALEASIHELRTRMTLLARYPLIVVEETSVSDADDRVNYQARSLMGESFQSPLVKLESAQRLSRGKVYLSDVLGRFLSLHPFAIYRFCSECSFRRLFMFDGFEGRSAIYNAPCDHRWNDPGVYDEIRGALSPPRAPNP